MDPWCREPLLAEELRVFALLATERWKSMQVRSRVGVNLRGRSAFICPMNVDARGRIRFFAWVTENATTPKWG